MSILAVVLWAMYALFQRSSTVPRSDQQQVGGMSKALHQSHLSGIRFSHFKAFQEEVAIDLAPITLIAGVNSGGKSSILQTLLLARQTLLTPYRSTQEDALVYDGDLVRFADFKEMVYGKPEHQDGWFELGFTMTTPVYTLTSRPDDFFALPEDATSVVEDWEGTFESRIHTEIDIRFEHTKPAGVMVTRYRSAASLHYAHGIVQGPTLTIDSNSTTSDAWTVHLDMKDQKRSEQAVGELFDRMIPVWRQKGFFFRAEEQDIEPPFEWEEIDTVFQEIFTPALAVLRRELTENLYYIGPLRSAPQRPYTRRAVTGLDIGATGEYTIQQLHEHWDDHIPFVAIPDHEEFDSKHLHPTSIQVGTAVRKALQLLGMTQQIKIKRPGQSYEASLSLLSEPETYVAITDVGFGVSQILPVIALGLLSPANAILLFEQPEIHLHPQAQAGLADFFLCLARSGKRVLVETHSDHLIDRFRRRMAEDTSDALENYVQVLFVHPPAEGRGSRIEIAKMDRYGMIINWPSGFLTESAKDARAIMLAASAKRLQEKAESTK